MRREDFDMLMYLVLMGATVAVLIAGIVLLVAENGAAIVVLFVTSPVMVSVAISGAIIGFCAWLWGMYG